jgi:hypothetical protein
MLPFGFAGRAVVAVAAGFGVATTATGVRVRVGLGNAEVGEAGSGVKVGGTVAVAGGLVAVGGGGGSVIVGVGTRVGVGGALHPTATMSIINPSRIKLFSFTNLSFQRMSNDKFNRRDTATTDKRLSSALPATLRLSDMIADATASVHPNYSTKFDGGQIYKLVLPYSFSKSSQSSSVQSA